MTDSVQQLACLQTVNTTLLVTAIGNVCTPSSMSLAYKDIEKIAVAFPFGLIIDGIEIPVHPLKAFLSGTVNHVPILTGANHDEYLLRVLYEDYSHLPTSPEDYVTRVLPAATYSHSEVQALYDLDKFNGNYSEAFVALLSQGIFIYSARRMAGYMTGQPTYLYTYNHAPQFYWLSVPSLVIWSGAYHSAEVFSLFQTLAPTLFGDDIFEAAKLPLATSLRRYWTSMITKHQPNDNSSFTWPQYSSASDQAIVLNINVTNTTFIDVYPNCDLFSGEQVKVFDEYLGLNVSCIVENKCFITDPASAFASQTNKTNESRRRSELTVQLMIFSCAVFVLLLTKSFN